MKFFRKPIAHTSMKNTVIIIVVVIISRFARILFRNYLNVNIFFSFSFSFFPTNFSLIIPPPRRRVSVKYTRTYIYIIKPAVTAGISDGSKWRRSANLTNAFLMRTKRVEHNTHIIYIYTRLSPWGTRQLRAIPQRPRPASWSFFFFLFLRFCQRPYERISYTRYESFFFLFLFSIYIYICRG